MASRASPPSQASEIPPLRSIVFLGLAFTSFSFGIFTFYFPFIPDVLGIAFDLFFVWIYVSSIIGSILVTLTDKTPERAALTAHFVISAAMSFILCISKFIEKGGLKGFTGKDFGFCIKMVIWTVTCGMLSAIWIRRGVEGLKREAKAVPGNLWLFLYE